MQGYCAASSLIALKDTFVQHWRNIYISFIWCYYFAGIFKSLKATTAVIAGFCGEPTSYPSFESTLKRANAIFVAVANRNQTLASKEAVDFFNDFPNIASEELKVYKAAGGSENDWKTDAYKKLDAEITGACLGVFAIPTIVSLLASQPKLTN